MFSSSDGVCNENKVESTDYQISLIINPQTGHISVSGTLTFFNSGIEKRGISLYLDSNMVFSKFIINGLNMNSYKTERSDSRFMPLSKKIYLEESVLKKDKNLLEFEYSGTLGTLDSIFANVVGNSWTEIGLYYPWFPFSLEGNRLFSYSVRIKNLNGKEIFGIGKVKKEGDETLITSTCPTNDIPICISDKVKHSVFRNGGTKIHIYHSPEKSEFIRTLSSDILNISYSLQKIISKKKNLEVVFIESQRRLGGGYARQGGIILGGLDPQGYHKSSLNLKWYIAHEMAHLWWYKANTGSWEDWLNESFAEMSAALVIRESEGEELYNKIIDKKRELSQSTPPIWGFDRNGCAYEISYKVLYNKGVCLLSDLEDRVGREEFQKLFTSISKSKICTTSQLLDELRSISGEETAIWFERLLKNS